MIRLFVALSIPDSHRRSQRKICCGVRSARWINEESFHLTLGFIGEVEEPELDNIILLLSSLKLPQFQLKFLGVGYFKIGKNIHSLWARVEANDGLLTLCKQIKTVLREDGIRGLNKKFVPHVTLARLKRTSAAEVSQWLAKNVSFRMLLMNVGSFELFESYISKSTSIYTSIQKYPLMLEKLV